MLIYCNPDQAKVITENERISECLFYTNIFVHFYEGQQFHRALYTVYEQLSLEWRARDYYHA